jgi:hypothetical protein
MSAILIPIPQLRKIARKRASLASSDDSVWWRAAT